MLTDSCCLLGAGGHALVVLEALLAGQPHCTVGIRDDNPAQRGMTLLGRPILTPCIDDCLRGVDVHVTIGDNDARMRVARAALASGARLRVIVHPRASVSPTARLGGGIFIAAQAVVGPEALLGDGVIINHGAIVDHDCHIGEWAHVAPRAVLGGGVRIGFGALLGSGCVVLPGLQIGAEAIVGAGAVVTRAVPAGHMVKGVPAR